jgi:hypothetical protein
MKYLVVAALLVAISLTGGMFLWLSSGWLTMPLGEEGA